MQRAVLRSSCLQGPRVNRLQLCRTAAVPTQMRPLPAKLVPPSHGAAMGRRQSGQQLRVSAAALDPLEPWQAVRMHEEFDKGRRNVKVSQVARELEMDREEVIMCLKEFGGMTPGLRKSMKEAALAARDANKERRRLLREDRKEEKEEEKQSFAERQALGGDFVKKRMSKAARDTLETVWLKTRWPDDELIRSIYKLHRVPRHKTLAWFAEKRDAEPHQERERRKQANEKRFMNKNFKDDGGKRTE